MDGVVKEDIIDYDLAAPHQGGLVDLIVGPLVKIADANDVDREEGERVNNSQDDVVHDVDEEIQVEDIEESVQDVDGEVQGDDARCEDNKEPEHDDAAVEDDGDDESEDDFMDRDSDPDYRPESEESEEEDQVYGTDDNGDVQDEYKKLAKDFEESLAKRGMKKHRDSSNNDDTEPAREKTKKLTKEDFGKSLARESGIKRHDQARAAAADKSFKQAPKRPKNNCGKTPSNHPGSGSLRCSDCNGTFAQTDAHVRTMDFGGKGWRYRCGECASLPSRDLFCCSECDETFGQTEPHTRTMDFGGGGGWSYRCGACAKLMTAKAREVTSKGQQQQQLVERRYACDLCRKSFAARAALNLHKRERHGELR